MSENRKLDYPFSKTILVINTTIAILSLIFSVYMFSRFSDGGRALLTYIISTSILAVFSFTLKIFAAKKILESSTLSPIDQEPRRGLIDRNLIMLLMFSSIVLLLPLILQAVLGASSAILFLAVYVTGFTISDPFVYFYCKKGKGLN